MNPAAWKNLIWKEWREQRGVLFGLVVLSLGVHLLVLRVPGPTSSPYVHPLWMMAFVATPLCAVFVALNLAAGEHSRGTIGFLRSLPAPPSRVALVKVAMAIGILFAAQGFTLLLTEGLLWLADWNGWGGASGSVHELIHSVGEPWQVGAVTRPALIAVSLILWFAALGVNRESEVRAAVFGLVGLVAVWSLFIFSNYLINLLVPGAWRNNGLVTAYACVMVFLPGGFHLGLSMIESVPARYTAVGLFAAVNALLLACYLKSYARTGSSRAESAADSLVATDRPNWLGPPRSTPLRALIWKQARQSAPVVLAGVACAVLVGVTILVPAIYTLATSNLPNAESAMLVATSVSLFVPFLLLGACAGLVIGVGTITSDLEPGLATFWRSRPIVIDQWFLTAILVGAAAITLGFVLPSCAGWLVSCNAENETDKIPLSLVFAPFAVIYASYFVGVFAASLVRHTVYACLLGLVVGGYLLSACWENGPNTAPTPSAYGWLAVTLFAMTLLAWQAVRRDWAILRP